MPLRCDSFVQSVKMVPDKRLETLLATSKVVVNVSLEYGMITIRSRFFESKTTLLIKISGTLLIQLVV